MRQNRTPVFYMIIFHSDLDNTLIYSYKHDLGPGKVNVEIYQNREISFVTAKTAALLKQAADRVLIVPTTTRTIEQYNRIQLGLGRFQYVLACNGGVLLVNGKEDESWYQESLRLISESSAQMDLAKRIMEKDGNRNFELRYIKDLFLFTKSSEPELSVQKLKAQSDASLVDVFHNGVKVYAVPKKLNKGMAVKRFRERLGAETVIAAGDSEFDISMLNSADYAIAPENLGCRDRADGTLTRIREEAMFSEKVLERVLEIAQKCEG